MVQKAISPLDYVIFGAMLLISLLIGVFYAIKDRKSKSGTEGYLMASRSMSFVPVAVSLAVSFQSSVTVVGVPSDVYHYGMYYLWSVLSMLVVFFVVSLVFLPIMYNLRISSAYEYLDKRYNHYARLTTTTIYLLTNLLYMGINIYGPALALSKVTGIDLILAMMTTGMICVIYTALGGLRGVIWTDVFQGLIMLTGMLSILIKGSILLGGFSEVWRIAQEGKRTSMIKFDPDPRYRYSGWSLTIGIFFMWCGTFGTHQAQVQRMLSVKSQKTAVKALALGLIGIATYTTLAVFCGLIAYGIFHQCDPTISGCVTNRDEIYPSAVFNLFHDSPGLPGLFLATVFSASLSTVSSGINAMSVVVLADYIKPHTDWSERVYTWIARGVSFLCGLISLGIAVLASVFGDILSLGIASGSSFIGPSLGVFMMGLWCPFVNAWGSIAGMVFGFGTSVWVFIQGATLKKPHYLYGYLEFNSDHCPENCDFTLSPNITYFSRQPPTGAPGPDELYGIDNLYAVSVFYICLIGMLSSLAMGIFVSLISGGWKQRHNVNPQLMKPPFESKCFSWIPENIRSVLRCGIRWTDSDSSDNDEIKVESERKSLTDIKGNVTGEEHP